MSTTNLVFVYGTLLRGEPNHGLLRRARLWGIGITHPVHRLVDLGGYPALVRGGDTSVRGEVFQVDDETLRRMDQLEGHPEYYVRAPIELLDGLVAETYFLAEEDATGCPVIEGGDWRLHKLRSSGGPRRR